MCSRSRVARRCVPSMAGGGVLGHVGPAISRFRRPPATASRGSTRSSASRRARRRVDQGVRLTAADKCSPRGELQAGAGASARVGHAEHQSQTRRGNMEAHGHTSDKGDPPRQTLQAAAASQRPACSLHSPIDEERDCRTNAGSRRRARPVERQEREPRRADVDRIPTGRRSASRQSPRSSPLDGGSLRRNRSIVEPLNPVHGRRRARGAGPVVASVGASVLLVPEGGAVWVFAVK